MRITRRPSTSIPGSAEIAQPAEGGEPASRPSGGPVTDRVQLSEAARLRQRLRTEIGDPSEISRERVEALQTHVANQTYAPDPRAVADRLLRELTADLLA